MSFEGLEFVLVEQLVEAVQPVCWDDRRVVEQRLFALDVILRPVRDPAQQRIGILLLCGTVGGVGISHTGMLRPPNILVRAVTDIYCLLGRHVQTPTEASKSTRLNSSH